MFMKNCHFFNIKGDLIYVKGITRRVDNIEGLGGDHGANSRPRFEIRTRQPESGDGWIVSQILNHMGLYFFKKNKFGCIYIYEKLILVGIGKFDGFIDLNGLFLL